MEEFVRGSIVDIFEDSQTKYATKRRVVETVNGNVVTLENGLEFFTNGNSIDEDGLEDPSLCIRVVPGIRWNWDTKRDIFY